MDSPPRVFPSLYASPPTPKNCFSAAIVYRGRHCRHHCHRRRHYTVVIPRCTLRGCPRDGVVSERGFWGKGMKKNCWKNYNYFTFVFFNTCRFLCLHAHTYISIQSARHYNNNMWTIWKFGTHSFEKKLYFNFFIWIL